MDERVGERAAAIDSSAPSDASLIEGLKAGEERAAEQFVRTHGGWMLAVARRIAGDTGLAEDCVQEAFLKALKSIESFEGRSSLKTWLHRIVVNQTLMKLRSRKSKAESPLDELLPAFDENACRIEEPWETQATPEEICERQDQRSLVQAKIKALPESYRLVLQLRDIEEMTTQEVAVALGLSEANVKVRLHRARSALKKLLEPLLKGDL